MLSQGGVLDLAAAEDHGALHLVAGFEEARGLTDPHVVIVLIDLVAHLHLLHFGLVRLLLGFFGLLFLLELELAVVHDPAHRRISLLAHQHQVELAVFGYLEGRLSRDHPQLAAVGIHHPELGVADAVVDVGELPHGSAAVKTRTGWHSGGREDEEKTVSVHPSP